MKIRISTILIQLLLLLGSCVFIGLGCLILFNGKGRTEVMDGCMLLFFGLISLGLCEIIDLSIKKK